MKLNALLVDISVLGPQGWEFLEKVCGAIPGLGVLVCTSQSTVAQRVRGLRLGADDWIGKPSHPEEVMARIEAVVRRRKRAAAARRTSARWSRASSRSVRTSTRRSSAARASASPAASSSSSSCSPRPTAR